MAQNTPRDPNELVDVINPVNGDRTRVSRAYLERWPDDYVLAEDATPAQKKPRNAASRSRKTAAAPKTPAPATAAEEPKNPVDDPEKEQNQ